MSGESKYKIGIFGSAVEGSDETRRIANDLGAVLGQYDVILITGAGGGVPSLVTVEAHKGEKVEIWGYTAARDLEEHRRLTPQDDPAVYARLIYAPQHPPYDGMHQEDVNVRRKLRNVASTDACDAGIIVAGRIGTLNEFTNLYDMEKVVGILEGTHGVADEIRGFMEKIDKPNQAIILYNTDPDVLVRDILVEVKKRKNS